MIEVTGKLLTPDDEQRRKEDLGRIVGGMIGKAVRYFTIPDTEDDLDDIVTLTEEDYE